MAQDLNREEVLIARNNETGQVGAVTGLNEDGTPKMTDVKSANISDLVKFSKGQNPMEAFMSNFLRQCKNPTIFGFFKVAADQFDTVGVATAELAKDPVANAEMLKDAKVEQMPAGVKYAAIDENRIDWPMLKEKWGIDRDALEKSGDLKEMLYNRKSGLVTVTPTFAGEKFPIDARLSFRTDGAGNVKVVPHFIRREPKLDQEFEGYKFTKEDKANLRETGNLGKVVELTDKATGEKVPSYVSIDRYTNEIVAIPAKSVFIKDTIGQTKLSMAEIGILKSGKALPPKEITDKMGKTYTVVLQVNADRKGVEFVPGGVRKMEQKEVQAEAQKEQQKEQQSTWLTKDGAIKPLSKWAGVPLTDEQQKAYVKGDVVKVENIVDKKGQQLTVYLQFNPEKQRPITTYDDPRMKVAEESKTQAAVNNEGLTNEATKGIKEPLQKGQVEPKNEAQEKQQKKARGPKL